MSRTRPPLRPWVGAAAGLHRTRRANMASTELQAIVRFRFHDGDVEEFKRLSAQCMEIVRTQDTGTLQYDTYFNDDETELIVIEFVTLDGVAQAPGGPDEDRDSGFAHGGWQAPLLDQESGDAVFEHASSMDALLLGRKTYEIFANYWPSAPEEIPFTGLLNGVPKYVASRTLAGPLAWQGSTLVAGNLAEGITSLKERHDEVHVIGSLNLVQSLLQLRLIDRLNLWL